VAMYKTPKDAGGFDAYYFNTHVPIAVTGQVRLHFFPRTTVRNFLDSGI